MVDHAPLKSLLSVKEAAARLTQLRGVPVSTQAVYRMTKAKQHRLPTIRLGRAVFIANLDQWLAEQADASAREPEPVAKPAGPIAKRVRSRKSRTVDATFDAPPRYGIPSSSVRANTNRFGTPARERAKS